MILIAFVFLVDKDVKEKKILSVHVDVLGGLVLIFCLVTEKVKGNISNKYK